MTKSIQELNGVSKTRGELVLRHIEAKARERIECELVDRFSDELDHKIRDALRTAGRGPEEYDVFKAGFIEEFEECLPDMVDAEIERMKVR
jgi:hypothetical protein